MTNQLIWHFLVVDDSQAPETEEFVRENRVLAAPDFVKVETCLKFSQVLEILDQKRVDLVILDLKDDAIDLEEDDKPLSGEVAFEQIQSSRFVPVIFYTAFPEKVKHLENPYVRVVKRGKERELRTAVKDIFDTGLPRLIRHLEIEQRKYMWDHVGTNWQGLKSPYDKKTDLSYLLARRLANTLERSSIRRFLAEQNVTGPGENDNVVYPIEMYVYPPLSPKLQAGDILKGNFKRRNGHWIVITPSCDIEHDKVAHVILAACFPLAEQHEYKKVQECIQKKSKVSNDMMNDLNALIGNNRNAKVDGKRFQPQRYIFLPGTFFIPDLVVDFQALVQIKLTDIKSIHRITSLDSPFSEAYLAQFSEYYGRLGTPDLDKIFVYKRIVESIANED
jgi:hypothetical protein